GRAADHVQIDDVLALAGEVRLTQRRVEAGLVALRGGARLIGLERRQRRRAEREARPAEEMPPRHVQGKRVVEEVHVFSSSVTAKPMRRFGVVAGGGSIIL